MHFSKFGSYQLYLRDNPCFREVIKALRYSNVLSSLVKSFNRYCLITFYKIMFKFPVFTKNLSFFKYEKSATCTQTSIEIS